MYVVDSDAFLDMPLSTQALYFHLNMRADDDGFVGNPKKIMRIIGASEDDLKLLIAKNFLLTFENGVIVIKHWRMHNTLSANRYHETNYVSEKGTLLLKSNGSYSLNEGEKIDDTKLIEMSKRQKTDNRRTIGEQKTDSDIDSDSDIDIDINNKSLSKDNDCPTEQDKYSVLVAKWNELSAYGIKPIKAIKENTDRIKYVRARKKQYGDNCFDEAIERIKNSDFLQGKHLGRPWQITFDWLILPNNFPKVIEGNYDNNEPIQQTLDDYGDYQ